MKANSIFDMSVWYGFVIAVVVLVSAVCGKCGTLTTYRFVAPGLGGMVSNYDDEMLQATDVLYLFNGYVTETPGMIQRRTAISDYGVNVTPLYGAFGYYNPLTGDKLVLGVTDHATYELGQFVVSDTFGTEVGYDTLGGTIFPYADAYHDFTPYKDMVVCADGKSIPCVFSTSEIYYYSRQYADTLGFNPHLISMGLEAPGQPRVGATQNVGNLKGKYVYSFAFEADSVPGIISRQVEVDSQSAYITNFPMDTGVYLLRRFATQTAKWYPVVVETVTTTGFAYIDTGAVIDTQTQEIIRVRWYRNDSTFYDVVPTLSLNRYNACYPETYTLISCGITDPQSGDSLGYRRTFWDTYSGVRSWTCPTWLGCVYLDSVTTDVDSFFIDTIGPGAFLTQVIGRIPGQFYNPQPVDTIDTLHFQHPDSAVRIAYSYYDPVTGMESPLGPSSENFLTVVCSSGYCSDTISYNPDSIRSKSFLFDRFDSTLNPHYLRVYQTISNEVLGGGDTMIYYGLLELYHWSGGLIMGQWTDEDIVDGSLTQAGYYQKELLRDPGVKMLPPYNYDCQITFSDIEYMAGQFWGIGDPDYPNRIYFSEYDWVGMNIFSWYPMDFVQIQEIGNDELVKIERAEGFGADALYVFAHNSVWLLNTSGDYQAISTRVGAASQETVVKHGEGVYFLSPNLRLYVLTGGQLQEISQPVENYVESVFVDWNIYGYQGFYAWAHTFGDYVRWFNDTTGMGLSFNTKSGVWTLERYGSGAYVPRGSISYDTMRSSGASVVMTSDIELLYMDSAVSLRKADPTVAYDVAGSGYTNCLERAIQFACWMPRLGDGTRRQQIQEFDVTLDIISPGAFHYTIYDEYNDSLCGDSVPLVYNDTTVHLRIHTPYNNCLRPSLKIYSNDTDTITTGGGDPVWGQYYHNFSVKDLTVKVRDMGVGHVQ